MLLWYRAFVLYQQRTAWQATPLPLFRRFTAAATDAAVAAVAPEATSCSAWYTYVLYGSRMASFYRR